MKYRLYYVIYFVLLLHSCSSDESTIPDTETESENVVLSPEIESLSAEFIVEGDKLTIQGNNFINTAFQTIVSLNDVEYEVIPKNNTSIDFNIPEEIESGTLSLEIRVSDKKSEQIAFYYAKKGWNILPADNNLEYVNPVLLNSNQNVYVGAMELLDSENLLSASTMDITNFQAGADGFTAIEVLRDIRSFKIAENGKSIAVDRSRILYSNDSFQNIDFKRLFDTSDPTAPIPIVIIDENTIFVTPEMAIHTVSIDGAETFEKRILDYMVIRTFNDEGEVTGNGYRGRIKSIGKASNGEIYGIGSLKDQDHLVMKSNDYLSWDVLDSITPGLELTKAKFVDTDLILTNYVDNTLAKSSDLGLTWTNTAIDKIKRFFVRSKTEWWAVTEDNKLIVTTDSGQTWNEELIFNAEAIIRNVAFAENKVVVSGRGMLRIKYE